MKIHRYAHRGDITGVRQELERGVSIEAIDNNATLVNANLFFEGMTPLQCALASPLAGTDMVDFLIDRGAKLSLAPKQGKPDLHLAISSGKIEKIQLLLDLGADINYIDANGNNAVINALIASDTQGEAIALVQFLIKKGVKIDSSKPSALDIASDIGWFEIVRILLDAGCAPVVLEWRTDLMQAVGFRTVSEVEALLEKGTDVAELTVIDSNWRTPWLLSVHMGDVSKAQRLLAAGSNPLAVGYYGKLPLMYAIESGNLLMLAWLIEIGLDVNATDKSDETALMCAVALDRVDAVSILLEAGANPSHQVSKCGPKAIEGVRSVEVLERLLAAGADLADIKPTFGEGLNITPSIRSLVTKVDIPDEWELDLKHYQADKYPWFGKRNPEEIDFPFWREMVKFRCAADVIDYLKEREECKDGERVWCFHRFGQSITLLPDGRVIEIAGEHEDYYDPYFCIYNDVVVYDGRGDFKIYGYPRAVFQPTDFHTATWVDGWIYIIGNLGYREDRIVGETPVYRLNCTTFEIEKVITTGECPSWISDHRAVLHVGVASPQENRQIHISGGQIWDENTLIDNEAKYILDLNQCCWHQDLTS